MRLMEGRSEWEGRLEICLSQRWGTVGNDGWTDTNSQIVCSDLGYTEPDTGIWVEPNPSAKASIQESMV